MDICVTGGAGYIGSAAVKRLCDDGHTVIVIDNLSKGIQRLVDHRAEFYNLDLTDRERLDDVFAAHNIDAVMHFASYKAVGESMRDAPKYSDNITGTICLLDAMVKHDVKRIIYSSSAAVYGLAQNEMVTEHDPTVPINYYGYSKLAAEEIIIWYARIHEITYVSLRYFNVAGDAGLMYRDPAPENILPIIMEAVSGTRDKVVVFGDDYDTRDGTGVRDYIDINDLVEAHVLAMAKGDNQIINLGTSQGSSVMELITAVRRVTGKEVPYEIGDRREGDPATLLASNEKAQDVLGWAPQRDIDTMIRSMMDVYFA